MKWYTILLGIIVLVAFFLRAYNVTTNPPALSWDEVSIGYNAYSILKTGKDEHGKSFPLDAFSAFGDYKPPVAIYATVPFVAIFGLGELAVRLPSVLFGTASVALLYLLVVEMFGIAPTGKKKPEKEFKFFGLLSAGLLAITPWHIMLSRAGFEANIALFFVMLGIYFSLLARRSSTMLYVCWIPFVVAFYTFNSARYAVPLLALALIFMLRSAIPKSAKSFICGCVFAGLLLVPIVPHMISPQSRLRFEEVSIFTDLQTVLTSNARRAVDGYSTLSAFVHNRRIGYAREYLIHFFDHFEPRFLFVRGDGNPKFSIQDTGQLLVVTAPFLLYGTFRLVRDYPIMAWFLLWWLVVSIAPTAVARETPHALRAENALPVFIITSAYGIVAMYQALAKQRLRKVYVGVLVVFFLLNVGYFWHTLMAHYPKEFSGEWQYGYKQAIEIARRERSNYTTIVLTESIGRPYIYALFYEQYDPEKFWKTKDASFDAAGFYNVYGFDTYRFTKTASEGYTGKVLYILPPASVPTGAHIVETIQLLNGKPILVAFSL